jgi:hypothetical protein
MDLFCAPLLPADSTSDHNPIKIWCVFLSHAELEAQTGAEQASREGEH